MTAHQADDNCTHSDERGSTVMQVNDDRYECIVCGERFRLVSTRAALATPDEPVAVGVKWWVLADIAHERNESIVDIGGHCNHEESPPECIREGQATAAAYNARVAGRSWREASQRLHASGDDEPYATDARLSEPVPPEDDGTRDGDIIGGIGSGSGEL